MTTGLRPAIVAMSAFAVVSDAILIAFYPVSYTHLTLPTIYSV